MLDAKRTPRTAAPVGDAKPAATRYCLTVACTSTRGIVAAIAGYLAEAGCNITASSQFDDPQTGQFFIRASIRRRRVANSGGKSHSAKGAA